MRHWWKEYCWNRSGIEENNIAEIEAGLMKRILLNEGGTFYKINIVFCAELSETNCRAELSNAELSCAKLSGNPFRWTSWVQLFMYLIDYDLHITWPDLLVMQFDLLVVTKMAKYCAGSSGTNSGSAVEHDWWPCGRRLWKVVLFLKGFVTQLDRCFKFVDYSRARQKVESFRREIIEWMNQGLDSRWVS